MPSITSINSTDVIANSRAVINNNFATLNNALTQLIFNIKDYGAVVDGATDDTTAVNNAIAAAIAAGGGIIFFPGGTTRCNGAINIPYSLAAPAPSTLPYQKPLRFTGVGGSWNGYWTGIGLPLTGSILDLRYNGGDGTHIAKIDTRGAGLLEIDHLVLKSGGTDNYPFIRTTNTTVFIHHNAFSGNSVNTGTACVQDAIILGGNGTGDSQSADAQAIFQGYGSKISDNFYEHIQKCVTFQSECNGIEIENETISKTCGSPLTLGAPYFFNGGTGCRIRGGTIEVTNYKYAVSFNGVGKTFIDSLGIYDNTGYTIAPIYCDATSNYNFAIQGFCDADFEPDGAYIVGAGASTCSFISGSRFGLSKFAQGVMASSFQGNTLTSVTAAIPLGQNMTIDTGTGGSYLNINAYAIRLKDQGGTQYGEIMPGKAAGAIRIGSGATGSRPSASTAGAGALWYDTTVNSLIYSTGSVWKVLTGS